MFRKLIAVRGGGGKSKRNYGLKLEGFRISQVSLTFESAGALGEAHTWKCNSFGKRISL